MPCVICVNDVFNFLSAYTLKYLNGHEKFTCIVVELDRDSTDLQRASGLAHMNDAIDIYSCSWSNANDGTQLVSRQHLTYTAIKKAASKGRKGKGNIFVFSAGNHRSFDTCASDSLDNDPRIILVAAADQLGFRASYSESCAAVMVTSYSGDYYSENIVAPEVTSECDAGFSGTSAATPAVSAIIALTLEANPELTYRDVMHLITMTAEVAPLAGNPGTWRRNGAGFWVSNDFGFGLINAENMVRLSQKWTNVPRRVTCIAFSAHEQIFFGLNNTKRIPIVTDGCQKGPNGVSFLEQIELASTVYHPRRGRVTIKLISPLGTKTTMMEARYKDKNQWFKKWKILSVQNWGENPRGTWYVEVGQIKMRDAGSAEGYALLFSLSLHGTSSPPAHRILLPRTYAGFRLPDGTTSWDE